MKNDGKGYDALLFEVPEDFEVTASTASDLKRAWDITVRERGEPLPMIISSPSMNIEFEYGTVSVADIVTHHAEIKAEVRERLGIPESASRPPSTPPRKPGLS